MKSFNALITHYLTSFSSDINPLLVWGHALFLTLLIINLVWMALWHAFDQDTFSQAMPTFIKKFFVISIFYTVMTHPEWLTQLLQTTLFMGRTLTQINLQPQAILISGIQLSNKMMVPLAGGNLLTGGVGFIIALLVSLLVLFVFLSITLDVLVLLITTTFMISMASFFLGFAPQNDRIACQTLNTILCQCMKLLGLYLVIGLGLHQMKQLAALAPNQYTQLNVYVWISASVLLFWLLSKYIPRALSRIMMGFIEIKPGIPSSSLMNNHQTVHTAHHSNTEKVDQLTYPGLLPNQSQWNTNTHSMWVQPASNRSLSKEFSDIVRKLTRSKIRLKPENNFKKGLNV